MNRVSGTLYSLPALSSASRCNTAHLHYGQAAQHTYETHNPQKCLQNKQYAISNYGNNPPKQCNMQQQIMVKTPKTMQYATTNHGQNPLKISCKYKWLTGETLRGSQKLRYGPLPCDVMSYTRGDSSPV